MTIDLYTQADIKRVREELLKEQNNKDILTGLDIPSGKQVCDHAHDSDNYVRGVIHRNTNSALGRIENVWTRDLSWWYDKDLPTFLRQCSDYLERKKDTRYRHNSWIRTVKVQFNKLSASQQNEVLKTLGSITGSNPKTRKELFAKVVMDRSLGYDVILSTIKDIKNE